MKVNGKSKKLKREIEIERLRKERIEKLKKLNI